MQELHQKFEPRNDFIGSDSSIWGFQTYTPTQSQISVKSYHPGIKAFMFNAHLYNCTTPDTVTWAQLVYLKQKF